jgi:hypothetical protein
MCRSGSDNVFTPAPVDPHETVLRLGAETADSCSTVFQRQQDPEQVREQDNEQAMNITFAPAPILSLPTCLSPVSGELLNSPVLLGADSPICGRSSPIVLST